MKLDDYVGQNAYHSFVILAWVASLILRFEELTARFLLVGCFVNLTLKPHNVPGIYPTDIFGPYKYVITKFYCKL